MDDKSPAGGQTGQRLRQPVVPETPQNGQGRKKLQSGTFSFRVDSRAEYVVFVLAGVQAEGDVGNSVPRDLVGGIYR